MKYYILLILLISCSCGSDKSNSPNLSLLNDPILKNEDICYQFYEKFGFTDVCEHYRSLYKSNKANENVIWKKLPINEIDLNKINNLSNKVDKIKSKDLDVRYSKKNFFDDISLEKNEYFSLEKCNYIIDLNNGLYYCDDEKLLIYEPSNKMMYVEVHKCR